MKAKLTALVAGMVLACSAHAQSFFEAEVGIGASLARNGEDGLWQQEGFGPHRKYDAPAFEAGFTGNLYQSTHWGVDWHIDYAWLGQIHLQSPATPSDPNYNLTTKSCNGPCWPLANYMGSGHDQGFLFTLEPHVDYGQWRFGVEGGPYLHKATWSVDVTNWTPALGADASNLHVVHDPSWQLGWVIGAEVARGPFSVRYQYFMNGWKDDDPRPYVWKSVHMLTLKYTADIF